MSAAPLAVAEALALIERHARRLSPVSVPLADSLGLVLAENVASDIDSPPHDKSIVDGYAVRGEEIRQGQARLTLIEEIVAGAVPARSLAPGQTSRVMTGAPIPPGTDGVVMIERCTSAGTNLGDTIELADPAFRVGQNIMRRGASIRIGDIVLEADRRLSAIELGLLAEVGHTTVRVTPAPTIAVLATGDELVPPQEKPGPGEIRNSNETLLGALAGRFGPVVGLGIARDRIDDLRSRIETGLEQDVLLLSGGVSVGVLDLVPRVLAELGVREVFHRVNLKPGKPLWFGVAEREERRTLVFGLPGNPVSSLIGFRLLVTRALDRLSGRDQTREYRRRQVAVRRAKLGTAYTQRSERATYAPARTEWVDGVLVATPLVSKGSADLRALVDADHWIAFPAGAATYPAGSEVEVIPVDDF